MAELIAELEGVVLACDDAQGHAPSSDTELPLRHFIRTRHAEIAAAVRDASVLRSLAAAMYQAAGAYDMPVRFLDVLAAAGNGEPITEAQVYALLPCETPDFVRDKERLDWLADPENKVGNVQLPSECVLANLHSLRAAIDSAMRAGEGEG